MSDPIEDLILDLLEWVAIQPRPYSEAIDVWQTSCPRLPVWEEAHARGFLAHRHEAGHGTIVSITSRGRDHLDRQRPPALASRRNVA